MSNLLIDFNNVHIRVQSILKKGSIVKAYFNYVNDIKTKYSSKSIYHIFDGDRYYKKTIDSTYKSRKSRNKKDIDTKTMINIVLNLPNHYIVKNEQLEADDIAYLLCKKLINCVCVSEDRDWVLNLTLGDGIKLYQKGKLLHFLNFKQKKGYLISKIPLALFLSGDSKDGVLKPFRIKGSVTENANNYNNIADYCRRNKITKEQINNYITLISPVTHIPYQIIPGAKTENTSHLISKYKLSFLRSFNKKDYLEDYS